MLRRYVHGPGDDEPLVWYEGSGTNDRRFLHSDERGSVIATSNSSGTTLSTNAYDEYGLPKSTNTGRFQYTGQTWLPELGMYYYKARIYSPSLGRFLQTDPIGYGGGMNMYAYVGGDPANARDPTGLCSVLNWSMHVFDAKGNDLGTDHVKPEAWSTFYGCDWAARGFLGRMVMDGGAAFNGPSSNDGQLEPTPINDDIEICGRISTLAGESPFKHFGVTGAPLGLPPYGLQGRTVLSTIYGDNKVAVTYFLFLHKSVNDFMIIPNPFVDRGLTSIPSRISYRVGDAGLARIDIPANTFSLNRPESIHVSPQCPTKK
ncbi:MAG TPA: RHS repeat-associated core domain-containing protein [Allosphingosinicella sp.]|jgi:RHS repeat-associated protein|nr:RHS repeat-associated core domain-containing protein [Allosphingosinicella sp.]